MAVPLEVRIENCKALRADFPLDQILVWHNETGDDQRVASEMERLNCMLEYFDKEKLLAGDSVSLFRRLKKDHVSFKLTRGDLTDEGAELFVRAQPLWLRKVIDKNKSPKDVSIFDRELKKMRAKSAGNS